MSASENYWKAIERHRDELQRENDHLRKVIAMKDEHIAALMDPIILQKALNPPPIIVQFAKPAPDDGDANG